MGEYDSLRAAATLAKSPRVKTLVGAALTIVILPAAGWVGAKLDTKLEVDALTLRVGELTGKVAALESQRIDTNQHIADLTAPIVDGVSPGGPVTQLRTEVRYAARNAVRATAIALAFERQKAQKRAEAEKMLTAFDNRCREGNPPSSAANEAITTIALP